MLDRHRHPKRACKDLQTGIIEGFEWECCSYRDRPPLINPVLICFARKISVGAATATPSLSLASTDLDP
jgi:hypothetical protein